MIDVGSLSGGRTSGNLTTLLPKGTTYIYMDTGAEHPGTYKFIRELVENFKIKLVCLKLIVNPVLGVGNDYKVVDVNDLGPDLEAFKSYISKYSTPTFSMAACTARMKTEVFKHYCNDTFGAKKYRTWLGIRYDEPKRMYGQNLYLGLKKYKFEDYQLTDMFNLFYKADLDELPHLIESLIFPIMTDNRIKSIRETIEKRVINTRKNNIHYMASISEQTKQDVNDWWKTQTFDLSIGEWLGNCVFCIKKGPNKIALAIKDEPEMFEKFASMIEGDDVRILEGRTEAKDVMYRGYKTLRSIAEEYKDTPREVLFNSIRANKSFDSGSCSESCDAFGDQIDLF